MPSRRRALSAAVIAVAAITAVPAGSAAAGTQPAPAFIDTFGGSGTGDGQFTFPDGVAVSPTGSSVYVVDRDSNQVERFDRNGNFVAAWGSFGNDPGEMDGPSGVAVDSAGNVYVADSVNRRIQKFDATGTLLDQWGQLGTGDGEFQFPTGIAVDGTGNVYVTDSVADEVQVFDSTGTFVARWGASGSAPGQLSGPLGIDVAPSGRVYVADTNNHRVQEFTAAGTFVAGWGSNGAADGQFSFPRDLVVDATGRVIVGDGNDRLQRFTADGDHLTTWGSSGTGDGQFENPGGIDVTNRGDLYVADTESDRVQRFAFPRPDARIKRGPAGALAGDDRYNTTGANQARSGSARRGASVTYYASLQNDAAAPTALRVKGQGSTTHFRVRYFRGTANITGGVVNGSYTTPSVAPGATQTIRVVVTVKNRAPVNASVRRTLTARAVEDLAFRDTVRFTTARR